MNITTEAVRLSQQHRVSLRDAMDQLNDQSDRALFLPCGPAEMRELIQMFGARQVECAIARLGSREAARAHLLREGHKLSRVYHYDVGGAFIRIVK